MDSEVLTAPTAAPAAAIPKIPTSDVLMRQASAMQAVVDSIVIEDDDMYALAATELQSIKAKGKELEELRKSITAPMDQAKKNVMDLFRAPIERIAAAEASLKKSMIAYAQKMDAARREAQARADAAARAERERLEAEARNREAEAQRQRELAAVASAAGDHEAAATATAAADTQQLMAATVQQTAMVVSAPTVDMSAPKVTGISTSKPWKAAITDKAALLRFIADQAAENPEYLDWVDVKLQPLNQLAKAQKGAMRIPGVQPHQDIGMSARRA
jgi:hypothetical protein